MHRQIHSEPTTTHIPVSSIERAWADGKYRVELSGGKWNLYIGNYCRVKLLDATWELCPDSYRWELADGAEGDALSFHVRWVELVPAASGRAARGIYVGHFTSLDGDPEEVHLVPVYGEDAHDLIDSVINALTAVKTTELDLSSDEDE